MLRVFNVAFNPCTFSKWEKKMRFWHVPMFPEILRNEAIFRVLGGWCVLVSGYVEEDKKVQDGKQELDAQRNHWRLFWCEVAGSELGCHKNAKVGLFLQVSGSGFNRHCLDRNKRSVRVHPEKAYKCMKQRTWQRKTHENEPMAHLYTCVFSKQDSFKTTKVIS